MSRRPSFSEQHRWVRLHEAELNGRCAPPRRSQTPYWTTGGPRTTAQPHDVERQTHYIRAIVFAGFKRCTLSILRVHWSRVCDKAAQPCHSSLARKVKMAKGRLRLRLRNGQWKLRAEQSLVLRHQLPMAQGPKKEEQALFLRRREGASIIPPTLSKMRQHRVQSKSRACVGD